MICLFAHSTRPARSVVIRLRGGFVAALRYTHDRHLWAFRRLALFNQNIFQIGDGVDRSSGMPRNAPTVLATATASGSVKR